MWPQVAAIIWAQWRTVRNHLPQVGFASILGKAVSALWYAVVLTMAGALAVAIPLLPVSSISEWLAVVLLGMFAAWQIIPLFTLSTGWALQLNKLQVYPLRKEALFGIEILLRITASPELILILLGGMVGLMRHPALPILAPLSLLLLLPINLLLSLSIRELVFHSFERNRFRELFSILLILVALLPQMLVRSGIAGKSEPYLIGIAHAPFTPWSAVARLALGKLEVLDVAAIFFWSASCYWLARWFFLRSLRFEEATQSASEATLSRKTGIPRESRISELAVRILGDPMAAMVQKEMASLRRMPRFRVAFGMACVLSLLIVFPMALNTARAGSQLVSQNFLPMVELYGLLILSDALLLNVFGADRSAAAIYFVAPVPFKLVLRAKNLTAVLFIGAQAAVTLTAATALRRSVSALDAVTALSVVAVVGLFFLSVGNLTSILLARPSDPRQMMRKSGGGRIQLWMLLCVLGMGLLLGAAYLAQWAFDTGWAFFGVLAGEFACAAIFYKVAVDSAVEHAERDREKLIDALSKGAALIGSSS